MTPIPEDLPNMASPQRYLDDVRLVVRLTGSPTDEPDHRTSGYVCQWDGPLAVPLEDAARYVSAVAWNDEHGYFDAFSSTQRYTQFEWGASGYALEFAIDLVNSVSSEAVMAGIGYALAKIRGMRKGPSGFDALDSAESLAHTVKTATALIFEVDLDDLEVADAALDKKTATLIVRGGGQRYSATVTRLDTDDPVVFVQRED